MGRNKILASIGALGLITLLMLLCPVVSGVQAEDEDNATAFTAVNVLPMITVALQNKISMDVVPKTAGAFAATTAKLTVATNSKDGYSLYMTTIDDTQNLHNSDTTVMEEIGPVAAGATEASFGENTWGYSLDKNEQKVYHPIPTGDSTIIDQTDKSTAQNEYDLTFGTLVDTSLPAGQYSNAVIVSAVANPVEIDSLAQLTYMQNMTSEVCTNTSENVSKRLIDIRDGKSYWVAKLKDGNCWMTQNLALDISESGLSAKDTDISYDWTTSNPRDNYPPAATVHGIVYSSSNETLSRNLGEYVLATPTANKDCGSLSDFAACAKVGFVDVSSELWAPTYEATEGVFTYPDKTTHTGLVAVRPNDDNDLSKGGEYDAHYLIGNYYEYGAATAGVNRQVTTDGTQIEDSICPKNWRLPSAGANSFDTNGSFAYLLKQYGLATSATAGTISAGNYNISLAPLYFVRSGAFNGYQGGFQQAGSYGWYWSGTKLSTILAYMMSFSSSLLPSTHNGTNHNTYYGLNVRCLAR